MSIASSGSRSGPTITCRNLSTQGSSPPGSARFNAAFRTPEPMSRLEVNGVTLDHGSREVFCDDKRVELTTVEFDILEQLMRAAGRVLSRDALMEALYNRKATPYDRSMDMHISHLRKKLECGGKVLIKTIRGVRLSVLPYFGGSRGLNTVFTKTLLWFFGTVVLTFVALIAAAALNFSSGERRQSPMGSIDAPPAFGSSACIRRRGESRLSRRHLRGSSEVTEAEGVLTDA